MSANNFTFEYDQRRHVENQMDDMQVHIEGLTVNQTLK